MDMSPIPSTSNTAQIPFPRGLFRKDMLSEAMSSSGISETAISLVELPQGIELFKYGILKRFMDKFIKHGENLIQKGFHVGDFRKMKKFDQTPYKLPPPTPIHVPAEKRPLEEKSLPFSKKRSKVRITPVMRRVSRRSELPMAPVQIPDVLEPVQIPHVPEPPVQIPVSPVQSLPEPMQILPELDVLESTDAFDQLMSFVFGPQELQLLHTVPSIFDGNLFSFVDKFERAPMDLIVPRLNSCVKNYRI
ncbi:uncharacterized protein TNCV_1954971 [Trichonephila clavipes]|nr:uncharacterized protein TNCV_1954971 [Trichonephila clavipes]